MKEVLVRNEDYENKTNRKRLTWQKPDLFLGVFREENKYR